VDVDDPESDLTAGDAKSALHKLTNAHASDIILDIPISSRVAPERSSTEMALLTFAAARTAENHGKQR
jgi:hypothetical protein